ncbi:MAG TPA: phytoene/squalene synthase family protein [Terracidiphilus sp.]|nr:phytoene/squalene synthase family protein [Terracidiphilus sp.]
MTPTVPSHELARAYAVCRTIAKREAKNFYYAFVALPLERRNAICAIYAFMRQADDLADDETFPREERRRKLDAWLAAWREAAAGQSTADPVFMAVRDATQRFAIPLQLLDELVDGVTMDLDHARESAHSSNEPPSPVHSTPFVKWAGNSDALPDTYATFTDLYRYCYFVASVVGLVCIRIFGYSGERAEKLAEETGIAFQLTNILRDVSEDAARNRVYLPLTDLAAHGVSLDALLHHAPSAPPTLAERALLASVARRAEDYYRSADELLPLIHRESRPALWVLVSIYHALLKRIERADYDIFTRRASVPTAQKIAILLVGLARTAWARVST